MGRHTSFTPQCPLGAGCTPPTQGRHQADGGQKHGPNPWLHVVTSHRTGACNVDLLR